MTAELGILVGFTIFLSVLYFFSLQKLERAHRAAIDSVLADKKVLSALLKDAQNRIHAATMQDYLALQGRESDPHESIRRNDAIEAEIANRTLLSSDIGGM
jgi:hypothetical protein